MNSLKLRLQAYSGQFIFMIGKAVLKCLGNCLLAFAIKKAKEKSKGEIDMANPFWSAMGQIALAGIASYGSAKLSNSQTSWVPYRNQLVETMTKAALTVATAQLAQAATEKAKDPMEKAFADLVVEQTKKLADHPDMVIKGADKAIDKAKDQIEKISDKLKK